MKNSISIIIPSLGKINNIKKILDSIYQQNFNLDAVEVIIVLNGFVSKDDMAVIHNLKFKYKYFNIIIDSIRRAGVNAARNCGLQLSQNQILLFLDDDCELIDKHFLKKHLDFHQLNLNIFAYGGDYRLPQVVNRWDRIYNQIQQSWLASGCIKECYYSHLLGGNFSIKKSMLIEYNIKFDEDLIYGGTELEFFYHCRLKNLTLIKNELDVLHNTNESIFSLFAKLYKQGRGTAYIHKKFPNKKNQNFKKHTMPIIFNYIFWLGYYNFQKKYLHIFNFIYKDILTSFHEIRGCILQDIKYRIESKKRSGDRF